MEALLQNRLPTHPLCNNGGVDVDEASCWGTRRNSTFFDEVKGEVDGLMSCTESLGFESCDERMDAAIEQVSIGDSWRKTAKVKRVGERRKTKEFPPPLSTFNNNGHRSFILRSVRTDGRLELREVRLDKPEIFRSCREDGRLKLRLVADEVNETCDEGLESDENDGVESEVGGVPP